MLWRLADLTYPNYEESFIRQERNQALITRKNIIDRNGVLLATNLKMGSVYANPQEVHQIQEAIKKLRTVFPDLKKEDLRRKLTS